MAAGTSAAIFAFAEVVVVDGVVVVAAFLLLPPQPAARPATRETSARLPSETFKQRIFDPFRCWEPGSNPDLANENPKRAPELTPRYVLRTCSFSRKFFASLVSTTRPVSSTLPRRHASSAIRAVFSASRNARP